jgi:hypothetical protein
MASTAPLIELAPKREASRGTLMSQLQASGIHGMATSARAAGGAVYVLTTGLIQTVPIVPM